jgi:uncharacterized protein YbbC (DUF1343 family)
MILHNLRSFLTIYFICLLISSNALSAQVKLGVDILIEEDFETLKGKRIALLTNNAGKTSHGQLTAEVFQKTNACDLVSILTPEHGFYAIAPAGKKVKDTSLFGVPVYSLYGANRRPTKEQLENCDAVVVDIQDIGIRSYTYFSTVYKTMDACAEYGKEIFILDRPNPLGGNIVDGGVTEENRISFLGQVPVSYIHGCTIGELAVMANSEGWLPKGANGKPARCSLKVIKMQGWKRNMQWEDTGIEWTPTSPNIPTPDAIRGAAMLGIIGELGVISIGIGSDKPFQYIGMPSFDFIAARKKLGTLSYPGVTLVPSVFTPDKGMFAGKKVNCFRLIFEKDSLFKPYTTGVKIFLGIRKLYPNLLSKKGVSKDKQSLFEKATGTVDLYKALIKRKSDKSTLKIASRSIESYMRIREKHLIY